MKKKRKASGSAGGGEKRLKVEEQPSISSNVELMRSLRLSSTPVSSKMDQAFQFVERQNGGFHSTGVPMPQFVSFLAGWIQCEMMKHEGANLAMDARSWKIFHWCISSQKNLHIYPGMLKAIDLVLRTKIMAIKGSKITTINQATRFSVEEKAAVIEVLELLLRCYDRTFRPQLLDWTVFASSFFGALLESDLDDDAMKIGVSIADGFGKFLSTQANPKAAFQAMIDKVLAPLLKLQGALIVEKNDGELVELLLGAIGRVLDCGVFHTAAVEGFPIVCTAAARWLDEQVLEREANTRIQKMLFEKIKQLRDERCSSALASLGELLKIFAQRFKSFRASIKSDLFGVLGQREESETAEIKQDESGGESKSVRLSDNQQQFLVFIELALPLIQQLSDEKEISGKNMLIAAINNLFEVARDQGIYIPTRDTPTSGHFKFVKFYYGVLVDYAQSIRSIDDEADIGLGYREIVRGMSLVLEIDHRAVDDGVEAFWLTLLSATAIRSGDESAVAEAIAAGCRMLKISGELRNVDAIPRLFSCVKPIERFQLGLQRFFCDASFLESLRKMIETMPEAQSAEIVNMVSRFASETLTTLDTAEIAAVAASGEIQGQILENLKVSSTNAYQVGVNVRTIVDSVVADPLRQLLVKVANGKRSDRLGLRSFYLIRLYLTCRMLHRQCISMMSPEKAAAAAAAAHEFHLDSLELDWIEVALEQQELSIFAWIGQSTAVLAVVNGFLQGSGKNSFPSLYYLTDLLAIQRLADLQRSGLELDRCRRSDWGFVAEELAAASTGFQDLSISLIE